MPDDGLAAIGFEPGSGERIKLLHFITDSEPLEPFRRVAQHTDHTRFDLHVGSLDSGGRLQNGLRELNIPTLALGAERRSQYPMAVLRLARWLRHRRIDIVQVHLFDASIVGSLAARLARVPVTIFSGHHSHEIPLYKRSLLLKAGDAYPVRSKRDQAAVARVIWA